MSFNIFGPASKDSIRVGYISTERGFVDGISICEANEYAQLNPGTQFVFKTRDFIKYLNINEVNQLTPDDIVSAGSSCSGIQFVSDCGPAKAYFYGGGGVGVQGNPVIGQDGALLAVDLIHSGYGYQYPPIVEVKDSCGKGAGAVTRAVLGEVIETVEYYDQEGDFEEYELCEPTDVGYGRRYGPNGEDIGPWEPTLYANLSEDPIAREIKEYQDFLQQLQNPWWSTRKEVPLAVTSENKSTRTKFDVTDTTFVENQISAGSRNPLRWSDFMNQYAISPVPPSNVRGSDYAGIPFTFEWEEEFPYDGQYIFRGHCDNKAELYLDNIKLDDLYVFDQGPPKEVRKEIKAGVHRIRLDLLNLPIKEVLSPSLPILTLPTTIESKVICHAGGGFGGLSNTTRQDKVGKVIVGKGKDGSPGLSPGTNINTSASGGGAGLREASAVASGVTLDGTESAIANTLLASGPFTGNETTTWISFNPKANYIAFNGNWFGDVKTGYGYGGSIHLKGRRDGAAANEKYIYPIAAAGGNGAARIKYNGQVQDYTKPGTYEFVVPDGVTVIDLVCIGGGGSGFYSNIINNAFISKNSVNDTGGSGGAYTYDTANVIPGTKLKVVVGAGGQSFEGGSSNGGDTYIEIMEGEIPQVTVAQPKESTTTISTKRNIFNTIDYINKADRALWRANPSVGRDGDFLQQYGITPFDPNSSQANTDSFAGTHSIRWTSVDFPVDGNYIIELMVDDNVTLYIGNRDSGGIINAGNGLESIETGGDEVIIKKNGFSAPGQSTGKTTETRYFKAGKYRIRADLEQIAGKSLAQGNPMALAINIQSVITDTEVISSRSWNENPMGVALTIEAPNPPIPQEPIPQQEGRCPNNPIWTTRFPSSKERWYPVNLKDRWSKFMNRYSLSPIPPLSTPGSDLGGIVYRNSWDLDIPYDGFYALKSTVDDAGKILIDGQVVASSDNNRASDLSNSTAQINLFRNMSGFDDAASGFSPGQFGYEKDYPYARSLGFTDADIRNYLENEYGGKIGPVMQEKLADPNWGRATATLSSQSIGQIFNWKTENPTSHKIFLTKGRHTIEVEVENITTNTLEVIDQKIFDTKDWLYTPSAETKTKTDTSAKIVCHAGGGFGGLQNSSQQTNVGKVLVGKGGDGAPGFSPGLGPASNVTEKTGGGAGTISGVPSRSSGVNLDGSSTSISVRSVEAGEYYGLPRRFYFIRGNFYGGGDTDFSLLGLATSLDERQKSTPVSYISLNGGTEGFFKTGYGYGGSFHINALRWNGNTRWIDPVSAAGGSGAVQIKYNGQTQDYTKPGTYEFVVPEGVTSLDLICIGGGGSGYSEKISNNIYTIFSLTDSGGSGGAYAYNLVDVTPGTKLKIIVGAGGGVIDGGSQNGEDSYVEVLESTTTTPTPFISQSPTTVGVVYEGPVLATYRTSTLGPLLTPEFKDDDDYRANNVGTTWISKWSNIDFPEDGRYELRVEADDEAIVRIGGEEIGRAKVYEGVRNFTFNASKGKRIIEIEFRNIEGNATSTFETNPVGFNAIITNKVNRETGISRSWTENPTGISAMLIPPPCPKRIRGRGVVTDVIVDDPGNGNPRPGGGDYPVALRLKNIIVEDPGINYRPTDQVQITPSNGAVLEPVFGPFGKVTEVKVLKPGLGFTTYPEIVIPSETGINARFRPQFEVVRDPVVAIPERTLIQVTDLVGLKQTGYVDGRPYYGAVFYKDGISYAGFYETPGDLVQVYATLQESITARVTTQPSAIQRQGTDVTSNDPRLNIPGTPQNLI